MSRNSPSSRATQSLRQSNTSLMIHGILKASCPMCAGSHGLRDGVRRSGAGSRMRGARCSPRVRTDPVASTDTIVLAEAGRVLKHVLRYNHDVRHASSMRPMIRAHSITVALDRPARHETAHEALHGSGSGHRHRRSERTLILLTFSVWRIIGRPGCRCEGPANDAAG